MRETKWPSFLALTVLITKPQSRDLTDASSFQRNIWLLQSKISSKRNFFLSQNRIYIFLVNLIITQGAMHALNQSSKAKNRYPRGISQLVFNILFKRGNLSYSYQLWTHNAPASASLVVEWQACVTAELFIACPFPGQPFKYSIQPKMYSYWELLRNIYGWEIKGGCILLFPSCVWT